MGESERDVFFRFDSFYREGFREDLHTAIQEELRNNPNSGAGHFWNGRLIFEEKGDANAAVDSLQTAVRLSPDTPIFQFYLAQALEMKVAYDSFTNLTGADPDLNERITGAWQRAIELSPLSSLYRAMFANYLAGRRFWDQALSYIEKAFAELPSEEKIRRIWLKIHLDFGQWNSVQGQGDPETGLKHFALFLQAEPNHAGANLGAGICCHALKRFEEAETFFRKCLPTERNDGVSFLYLAHFSLASLLEERGRLKEALETVKEGLRIDPESPSLKEMLDRLQAADSAPPPVLPAPAPSVQPTPSHLSKPPENGLSGLCREKWTFSSTLLNSSFCEDLRKFCLQEAPKLPAKFGKNLMVIWGGFSKGNPESVETAWRDLQAQDYAHALNNREIVVIGKFLVLVLQETIRNPTQMYDFFHCSFPEFVAFYSVHGNNGELQEYMPISLMLLDQLLLAFFDEEMSCDLNFESDLEFYVGLMKTHVKSPAFGLWCKVDSHRAILVQILDQWMNHLACFLNNMRQKAFHLVLDLTLEISLVVPEIEYVFRPLPIILSIAYGAFQNKSTFPGGLEALLERDQNDLFQGLLQVYRQDGWTMAEEPSSSSSPSSGVSVEFAYQAALEEILGDGVITEEENSTLKDLRDYLEISPDKYQQIFDDVVRRIKSGEVPSLDRDFSAEEFLRKLLRRIFSRGTITADEKNIVKAVANALVVDRETIERLIKEARETIRTETPPVVQEVSREEKRLASVITQHRDANKITRLFRSAKGKESMDKVANIMNSYRAAAKKEAFDKASELMNQFPVTNFFYEPAVYPFPVIGIFLGGTSGEWLRLQFKGDLVDVYFNADIRKTIGSHTVDITGKALSIVNKVLDLSVRLKGVVLDEDLIGFLDGVETNNGEYKIFVGDFSSLCAWKVIHNIGGIDSSGQLCEGIVAMMAGNLEDAQLLFRKLQQGKPNLADVLYYIGFCFRKMGENSPNFSSQAKDYFLKELEKFPNSVKTLSNLGVIHKLDEKWDKALDCFEKALAIAPGSLPTIATYLTTRWNKEVLSGKPSNRIPDYLIEYLSRAYQVSPMHPMVSQLIDQFTNLVGIDLMPIIQMQPVDSSFQ